MAPVTIAATVGYGGHETSHVPVYPGYPPARTPVTPTMTATAQPSVGLVDGQTITVTVRGLDPHTTAEVAECAWVHPVADGVVACSALVRTTPATPAPAAASTSSATTGAPATTRFAPQHTIATATVVARNPLRGPLTSYDLDGKPVHGHEPPAVLRCSTASSTTVVGQSCLIGVRGHVHGHRVVIPVTADFAPVGVSASATTRPSR